MRTLWVVTHSEATHHRDGLVGGWYDSSLSAKGIRDAEAIGRELRLRIPSEAEVQVYSSDLTRAAETAAGIVAEFDVTPTLMEGLREKSYGEAEGRPAAWLDERFVPPPAGGDRMDHYEGIVGSESKAAFAARVYGAVQAILEQRCEHQIVVTHGYAMTFVVSCWIKMPIDAAGWVNFRASSGGITELHEDDWFHNRQVVRLNDTRHLSES